MDDRNREEVHIGRGPRVRIETGWLVAVVAIMAVAGLAVLVMVMAFDSGNRPEPNATAPPGSAAATPTPTVIEKVVVLVATPTPGPTPTPIVIIKEVPVVREVIKEVVVTPTPGPTPTPTIVERVIEKVVVATPTPAPAPAAPQVVYTNDFEGAVGPEWSSRQTEGNPPRTHRFLGQFHEKAINLTLTSIPPHQKVTLSFDLYIIGGRWAGGVGTYQKGQDAWAFSVHNGPTLLNSSFSNSITSLQNYPDNVPGGANPGRSGAVGINLLGYDTIQVEGSKSTDTTYSLSFTFQHSSETLRLIFSARPYWGSSTWGLDNVVVKVQ